MPSTPRPGPRQRVVDRLASPLVMRLRAEKNRGDLFGLHAPARTLVDLVPPGRNAVDAGAARGLYTYWIAKNARTVWAFEPNPAAHRTLVRSVGRSVRVVNAALSDRAGTAVLSIPAAGEGEASLEPRTDDRGGQVEVDCRTLDSYDIPDLGFLKIDVEGHEMALLGGARATLERDRPAVFIELAEVQRSGAVAEASRFFAEELGYTRAEFMLAGRFHPLADYDQQRHQDSVPLNSSPRYVSNFLFRP